MAERHSDYARDEDDWYVEPAWCVDALVSRVRFVGPVHDPCCGAGTIPLRLGGAPRATGADLRNRSEGIFPVRDFLTDGRSYANIVTNPPFNIAVKIVEHAFTLVPTGGRIAIIANAKFLFSQGRYALFNQPETERVLIFSRRPSMPPGQMLAERGEACRGGGSIDFCWIVWRVGKTEPGAAIEWVLS